MPVTRREFIARVAQAGGFGAAFMTMHSLGLLGMVETEQQKDFPLPPSTGRGTKVIILGAGIAGLVSAYEMRRAGFDCTVLEARERPGGRNWTLRRGSKLVFNDGTTQDCTFDEGNYFNCGPARLPSIHKTMLGYCNELGVELEVEVNSSRRTLLQNDNVFGGKPIRQGAGRQRYARPRFRTAGQMRAARRARSGLHARRSCGGDGFSQVVWRPAKRLSIPGLLALRRPASHPARPIRSKFLVPPLPFSELLKSKFCRPMLFEEVLDMQPTMFQPVGGMDRIPYAFAHSLGKLVRYNSPITEIRKTSQRRPSALPRRRIWPDSSIEASYCICALPLTILRTIPNDFAPRVKSAIEQVAYDSAYKVAWESRRFWEQDGDEIYGGISFLTSGPDPAGLVSEREADVEARSHRLRLRHGKLGRLRQAALLLRRRSPPPEPRSKNCIRAKATNWRSRCTCPGARCRITWARG